MKAPIIISLVSVAVLLYAFERPEARPVTPRPVVSAAATRVTARMVTPGDSDDVSVHDDSLDVRERERRTTAHERTLYDLDSLYKGVNLWIVPGPGETANNPAVEQLTNEYVSPNWVFQDSAFVYRGDDCIKVLAYWGDSPWDPDTVVWTDICHPGGTTCFDSVTVALGCYDTIRTTVTDTHTVQICDTVCTVATQYQEQLLYFQWSSLGMAGLVNMSSGGCKKYPSPTSPYYGYIKFVLYAGQWYQLSDTMRYHHFVPAADSCYIPDTEVAYFFFLAAGTYGPNQYLGYGPWFVDSTVTRTGSREVPCEQWYGMPGVTRALTNCRDTLITGSTTIKTITWVSAGRDTTIWTDTCDCYVPYFYCSTEKVDSCWMKYIYEYTYTRDSVQCEKEYVIPLYTSYPSWPQPSWQICRGDPEIDTAYARFLTIRNLNATAPRTSATQVHIRTSFSGLADTCWSWSCMTDEDVPPVGANDFWIERTALDSFFPCPGPSCEIEEYAQLHMTDWCCEKDTTLVFVCEFEDGVPVDTVTKVVRIPDRTGACNRWTYTDWVKTDSMLVDSIRVCIEIGTRTYYQLAYRDTCCYTPTFNGEPFCNLWLVSDCYGPLYQDANGVWHIPCDTLWDRDGDGLYDGTDYGYIATNDLALQQQITTHRTDISGIRDSLITEHNNLGGLQGGDGSNYYHLTGDELTDVQKIPTIEGAVTDHETAIDGIRDSLSFAWLDSSYTSSFTPSLRGNIVYYLDATGGNIDVTLPAAASAAGKEYVFKRIGDGGANTVTIKATVDADENPTMAEWQSYRIRSNGSAWYYIE